MTAAPQKAPVRPTSYPSGWPTDSRSQSYEKDGEIFIKHPDRSPHRWDAEKRTWKEIKV